MALTEAERQLCNVALAHIGDFMLSGTDITSKQYLLCDALYPVARDDVLVQHSWNEAVDVIAVLQEQYSPVCSDEYAYRYALPSDCLRVLGIGSATEPYSIVGQYIYTNHRLIPSDWSLNNKYVAGQIVRYNSALYRCNINHTANLSLRPDTATAYWTYLCADSGNGDYGYILVWYVKKLTDPSLFSAVLYNLIALRLAEMLVVPLTGDVRSKQRLLEEYRLIQLPMAKSIDSQQGKIQQITISNWLSARQL